MSKKDSIKLAKQLQKEQEAKQKEAVEAQKAQAEALRTIIKKKVYPFLKEKNIDVASTITQVVYGKVAETFNSLVNKMLVSKLGDLEFETEDEKKVYSMIKGLTIGQASNILQGWNQAVDGCIRQEQKARKISELELLRQDFDDTYVASLNKK